MKKLLTLSCLLVFAFLAQAQNTYQVTVLGSITNPDGTGVAAQDVNLRSDTSFFGTWTYLNTVTTDGSGVFTDTIDIPDTELFGLLLAETADCNNGTMLGAGFFEMGMTEVVIDLLYCDTLNPPPPPPFDSCFADVTCDPAGNLVAGGFGVAPFTYLWNTGETTETIMPQDTGYFCVTITDSEGCVAEGCSHYVGNNGGGWDSCFVFIFEDITASGNIELVAQGFGADPTTYAWDNGETTQSITPATDGTYCVTATDGSGCSASACYDYLANNGGWDTCFVSIYEDWEGHLIADAGFGAGNYTFVWDNGETTQIITPTTDGIYCVTATDDTGCSSVACYDYLANNGGWDSCFVYIYEDITATGVTGLTAEGLGQAPHTYVWDNGETTQTIIPNGDGIYCVTSTDASGCTAMECYDYLENPWGQDSCGVWIGCSPDGLISAVALGQAPFTYVWNTGEMTSSITPTAPGDYCVTITDATGCVAEECYNFGGIDPTLCIVEISQIGTGLSAQIDNPQDYSFEWSNGETTQTIQPTETGFYCVVAIALDDSCLAEACTFWFNGNNGDSTCAVTIFHANDSIFGGDAFFALGTGVEPLTYTWDNGETTPFILNDGMPHCVTITDATGCVAVTCSDDTNNGPQSSNISGYIYTVDSTQFPIFVDGTVELIDAITGTVSATTDVANLNGIPFYDFGDVADGTYILRAMVNKTNGDTYIPTYHFSTTLNSDANEIEIPYNSDPFFNPGFDILVFETQRRPGKGGISGNVTSQRRFAQAGVAQKGDIAGLSILLFDDTDQPIGYYPTDADGNFTFPELAYGTYHVYIDVPGHNNAFFTVTLSEDAPNTSGLNFDILDKDIVASSGSSSADDLDSVSDFRIFPNPASGNVSIEVASLESRDMELRLQNISGVTMITRDLSLSQATQRVELDLENLTTGIYFVRLIDGNQSVAKKLIIE